MKKARKFLSDSRVAALVPRSLDIQLFILAYFLGC